MKLIIRFKYVVVCLIALSCTDTNDEPISTLANYLDSVSFTNGSVIACAASEENTNNILTFFYPEVGASDIRFYETNSIEIDSNNFSNYQQVFIESEPFFNGYLKKFTQTSSSEKWIIITFQLQGEVKVSNPIRSKQITKPTVWNDAVTINQDVTSMPNFVWTDDAYGDNAIYFQVVSDSQNNLLSGTYTFDNFFQFYNTDNVVLNITTQTPMALALGEEYYFTLMDVSEANWVNLVIQKSFSAQ